MGKDIHTLLVTLCVVSILLIVLVKVAFFSDLFEDQVTFDTPDIDVEEAEHILPTEQEEKPPREHPPPESAPYEPPREPVVEEPTEVIEKPEEDLIEQPEYYSDADSIVYTTSRYGIGIADYKVSLRQPYAKIVYPNRKIYNYVPYDTVYIDFENSRAIGYCEESICKNPKQGVVLPFQDFNLVTPDYWKEHFALIEGEENFYLGIETIYKKTVDTEAWMHIVYGLPLKIKEEEASKPEFFNYFEINYPDLEVYPEYGFYVK
jgi:hypothetical protein